MDAIPELEQERQWASDGAGEIQSNSGSSFVAAASDCALLVRYGEYCLRSRLQEICTTGFVGGDPGES